MLPETQCNEALVVKGATDFSIAAIMGRQSVCMDSPDKSSSKLVHTILLPKHRLSQYFLSYVAANKRRKWKTHCFFILVRCSDQLLLWEADIIECILSDGIRVRWGNELFICEQLLWVPFHMHIPSARPYIVGELLEVIFSPTRKRSVQPIHTRSNNRFGV